MTKTYYETLTLPTNASPADIKREFRRLAKCYHPDINKENNAREMFCAIYTAYNILIDPAKRNAYDLMIFGNRSNGEPNITNNNADIGSWQKAAESQASTYAAMSFDDFTTNVLQKLGDVAFKAFEIYFYIGMAIAAVFVVTAPFVLGPGSFLLWVAAYYIWKDFNKKRQ
ncbi:MAG TPA: DnaJ domain-containing protein [Kiritimatiellia bacterium]|nr:DnaJ domain-containing protein [Saprospiraceae bacterium]HMP00717.1 DnaJ domain-containing protein [Kiritimatiellia bacterium]